MNNAALWFIAAGVWVFMNGIASNTFTKIITLILAVIFLITGFYVWLT